MPDSFHGFCSLWPGGIQRGRMRGVHPSPAIFQIIFDVYSFSIILNLFDSDKPYALTVPLQLNFGPPPKKNPFEGLILSFRYKLF